MGKEYPGNSNVKKEETEERKKLEKVVKNDVTVKKETVGKKMADVFLADNAKNVGNYFLQDILVPAIKDLIVDGVTSSINLLVRGSATRRTSDGYSRNNRESYSSYYRGGTSERIERREPPKPPKNRYGFREITYKTREDAKDVLYSMQDIVDRYKMVKVADYYELSGRDDLETYVDHDWGWYDVDGVDIMRGADGYVLNLPRPSELK